MKRFFCITLAALMLLTLISGCGEKKNEEGADALIVAMELAYPPFEAKDNNGDPAGVSIDIARAFGEYLGREVIIENTAWEGLIPSLQTGKADMVISSMTITDARRETVDFSDPYANAILALLVNINAGVESIDDLNAAGMKIAVKTGSTGHTYAEKNLPEAELVPLADESACVLEVSQGKADAFIYDQLTIYRNWQSNLTTTNAVFIPFQNAEQWGAAFQNGNTELVNQFNAFLKEYRANGGFDEVTEKYLSAEKNSFDELDFLWFFDLQ